MNNSKITEQEKAAHHLQKLSDRPNAMTSYKQGKLSADDLKKLLDARFDFLADRLNLVVDDENDLYDLYGDLDKAADALLALVAQVSQTENVSPANLFGGDSKDLAEKILKVASEIRKSHDELIAETIAEFAPQENNRIAAEETRESNEGVRQQNETARQSNEGVRQQNENARMAVIGDISEALEKLGDIIDGEASALYYPVGAVYISFESTSPSRWYGGTWEKLEEGRFLMASESSGIKQGNRYHSHDGGNLYADVRIYDDLEEKPIIIWQNASAGYAEYTGNWGFYPNDNLVFEPYNSVAPGSEYSSGITVNGTTAEAEALPPYITVHMWRRIA